MAIPSARSFLASNPIVPVVVLEELDAAVPTAQALLAGGITSAEITFRTAVAADAIAAISEQVPEMAVGAGTVINAEQARQALSAGAQFIVSPGWSSAVADVASEAEVPYLPGIANPTDIMAALSYGLDTVKFFPAVALGGLPVVKAFAGPFPQLKFMPTGGINTENLAEWLGSPVIAAVGGSWMVAGKLLRAGKFEDVTRISAAAMALAKQIVEQKEAK
ncbi:MAG: bifunctional 4-hydroxy-2-oxoglutarate aldolase/2-dehydro-3-deoxy-phosphogluconate aldolase [Arcanobacterium sp.]|nr:bifunctional 4-hydroxy-2-oxoglutarate aldolase/2-dehydro-3-deoxy-phosphogluconate aldolase [Arcanobacterium sp.]MDY5588863.1 bifunctional 4-hydroxy-2-oxoglutarate aldolase/2-dehydro-3-deoxy-phosphogluconate aldolase [Arcanobacterium sp.]